MNEPQMPALDQASFRRVWQRVMPQDRPDCPFTLEEPPAQQAPSAHPVLPVPAAPGTALPPEPVPAPAPPAQTLPARTAPTLPLPTLCLGDASAVELPTLERLLDLTWEARRIYRALSRPAHKSGRSRETLLPTLMIAKEAQARRLATAHFLISGKHCELKAGPLPRFSSLHLALRDRYRAEQEIALLCLTAAAASQDPCLMELYRALAAENQGLAGRLREWLEQL